MESQLATDQYSIHAILLARSVRYSGIESFTSKKAGYIYTIYNNVKSVVVSKKNVKGNRIIARDQYSIHKILLVKSYR